MATGLNPALGLRQRIFFDWQDRAIGVPCDFVDTYLLGLLFTIMPKDKGEAKLGRKDRMVLYNTVKCFMCNVHTYIGQ